MVSDFFICVNINYTLTYRISLYSSHDIFKASSNCFFNFIPNHNETFFSGRQSSCKNSFLPECDNNVFLQGKPFSAITCHEKNEVLLTLLCCLGMNWRVEF